VETVYCEREHTVIRCVVCTHHTWQCRALELHLHKNGKYISYQSLSMSSFGDKSLGIFQLHFICEIVMVYSKLIQSRMSAYRLQVTWYADITFCWPTVFQSQHHCPLADTKLYCLVTDTSTRVWTTYPDTENWSCWESNLQPFDCEPGAITITYFAKPSHSIPSGHTNVYITFMIAFRFRMFVYRTFSFSQNVFLTTSKRYVNVYR